jgi:hypothetical protein
MPIITNAAILSYSICHTQLHSASQGTQTEKITYCDMHACLRPLLSNGPRSTVETLVKQPLLSNGRINTQQWTAHATVEES